MKTNRQTGNTEEGSFDKTDLAILRVLLLDSRKTLQEIGNEVGLSPTSCWTRIKKLEATGVIKRYTAALYRCGVIGQPTDEMKRKA